VVGWQSKQIHGGAGGGAAEGGSAVYRLSGQARSRTALHPWTLVLKVLYPRAGDDPSGSHYWRREADAYQSGLLNALPGGLAAPRCFGVSEQADGSIWLCLEDVKDELDDWPLQRYGIAARHLGSFNAAFPADPESLAWSWLSADWIRKDLEHVAQAIGQLGDSVHQPLMRKLLPGNAPTNVSRLWAERESFLSALDRLPQVLCHFDAFRRNLFARRSKNKDQTVLIDWAFVGRGPVGAEIVSLVWVTLGFGEVEAAKASQLDEIVFAGYLRGLRDAGWRGQESHVRLGFTAATALRRLGTIGYVTPWILDERRHADLEAIVRRPLATWIDNFAEAGRFVEGLADHARQLMNAFS
jgi:hypothetical protein